MVVLEIPCLLIRRIKDRPWRSFTTTIGDRIGLTWVRIGKSSWYRLSVDILVWAGEKT